nr:hypothetical protein CFP56_78265 [Quercus suber]
MRQMAQSVHAASHMRARAPGDTYWSHAAPDPCDQRGAEPAGDDDDDEQQKICQVSGRAWPSRWCDEQSHHPSAASALASASASALASSASSSASSSPRLPPVASGTSYHCRSCPTGQHVAVGRGDASPTLRYLTLYNASHRLRFATTFCLPVHGAIHDHHDPPASVQPNLPFPITAAIRILSGA